MAAEVLRAEIEEVMAEVGLKKLRPAILSQCTCIRFFLTFYYYFTRG
jgi:hypothetical protein